MRAPAREVYRMRLYLIEKSAYQAERQAEQRKQEEEAQREVERVKSKQQ